MADSNSFILRGDDGQLYRIKKQDLAAHKLAPGDPANKHAGELAKMHDAAKKAIAPVTADLICFLAMREK